MFAETEQKFGKLDILIVNAGGAIGEGTAGNMAEVQRNFRQNNGSELKKRFFYSSESATALERWCIGGNGRLFGSTQTFGRADDIRRC
jgi:NAD(P)-dependent dehydrogenase (short-subunit alcohol dehydrogenase family)